MRKTPTIASILCLILILLSGSAFGQHQFRFAQEKTLVPAAQNPENPDMAWDGVNFGIVYHDFYYSNNSSGVYLLLVNTNGQVVKGPVKVSSKTFAMYPKIVWTGNAYGILYAAGVKKGTQHELKFYLARYNAAGNKLSEKELVGKLNYYYHSQYSKLVWTGSEFGIFYYGDPNESAAYINAAPLFCTADGSGNLSAVKRKYQYAPSTFDVIWNGKNYVAVCADAFSAWYSEGVVQVLILDKNGAKTLAKSVIGYGSVISCAGVSIIPIKKKDDYLVAVGNYFPTAVGVDAAAFKGGDDFAAKIKVKKSSISGLAPKNVTSHEEETWINPTLLRAGNNYYMLSNCGSGCSFAFARINDSGAIVSTPLHHEFPS